MVYPPRPGTISIPAVIAGNILQSGDTSVSVNDSGLDGHIVMKTQNTIAMIINPDQSASIGTEEINARLTVNNSGTSIPTLRLSYQDSFFCDSTITSNGNLLVMPSCTNPLLDPDLIISLKKNVDIPDHNGATRGLRLNGNLVTATATKLNYVDVSAGTAAAFKALVLDTNRDVSNINHLSASSLTGTLTTGIQWGITEVDTLNIRTQLSINGAPFTLTSTTLGYLDVTTAGVAQPLKAMVLDSNRDITNVGHLTASSLTGILTAGPQPNITSLSALSTLNVIGQSTFGDLMTITNSAGNNLRIAYDSLNHATLNTSSLGELQLTSTGGQITVLSGNNFRISAHNGSTTGLILGSQLVTATGTQLNYIAVSPGTAAASKALVVDASKNITGLNLIGSTSIAGTLTTGSQPNILSVSTLNVANHNGNTTGLALAGVLITATASKINYIDTTPGSAQISKALVVDSSRSISNINTLVAGTLFGTIGTTDQPNITSVSTLRITNHDGSTQGLTLGAVLVTSTANQLNYVNVVPGIGAASRALVLDTNRNINNINSLTTSTITGTLQTAAQPNINSVNTLNIVNHDGSSVGLSLAGVLVSATAIQLNRINVVPGVATLSKAMVLDSSKNISGINTISAVNLEGILTTSSQINVRILQSINIEDHNGATTGLSLGGTLITSTADQINALSISPGTAGPFKALILNSSSDIAGINNLTCTNVYGTIRTANQPYISSVSALNITSHDGSTSGLSLGGTLITVSAAQFNKLNVPEGNANPSKVMVLNSSSSITGINVLSATTLAGTMTTASQPNISSVNNLNVALHNGSTGLSLAGTLITASAAQLNQVNTIAGVAFANKAMILDSSMNFVGMNNLGATTITGLISTAFQPSLTSVNALNIVNHDGGSQGLRLGGILVVATANQLNYTSVVPGTATSGRALITNDSNSISGINQITANKLIASQLALTGVISNFNTGGVVIRTYSMTNISGRIVDIQLLPLLTFQNFQPAGMTNSFSSEIIGYIQPSYSETYTFYVNCNDRVRMWVNDVLVLHSWVAVSGYRSSSSIFLNANQWVKIYIQYQVDGVSSTLFNVQWQSSNTSRDNVPSLALAWDSNPPSNDINHSTQNTLTIYNNATAASTNAVMTLGTSGDLTIDASGNSIVLGTADNFNIPSHDGVSSGLSLGGVLVQPTAYEINYLKVNPGFTTASKSIVVDASKSITGINSLSATSISCTNLTTSAFTISNLSLSGPLNNYNTGSLLIRQITGADVSGRIVDVNTITDINLTNYDPKGLSTNFSLDIIGYVKPVFTEPYIFYATANDRVRIWVNNVLILNVWDTNSGLEYTSASIQMTANQWTPIYIQFQNISDVSSLIVRWSSTTLTKSFIPVSSMAWDNSIVRVPKAISIADSLSLFSSQNGLTTVQSGGMSVDSSGGLSFSTTSGTVSVAAGNNLNIVSHNGSTAGLFLSGSLVLSTAAELNRVSGVVPGNTLANKAIILDSSKAISGITTLTCDNLYSTVRVAAQPYITSIGTLSSTLTSTSDIVIGSTTLFRLNTNSTTSLISSSPSTTTDAAADLFIGNYNTTPSTSSRKFMIKASGALGIQTNTPNRALAINAEGAAYGMRLINNNTTGAETNYTDIGTDSSGSLSIAPSGTTTTITSNLILGKTSPSTFAVSSGVLKITSTSGSVQIGNSSNSAIPLEVGSATFALTGTVGFLSGDGSTGSFNNPPSTYSIRTTSSIIVNGTVCVVSDRRRKDKIRELNTDRCREFVLNSQPVSFVYKSDADKQRLGLIAQDVAQSEFKELVQLMPDTIESADDNGFVSPEGIAMSVSYTEIIPILMTTIKDLYRKNAELQARIDQL